MIRRLSPAYRRHLILLTLLLLAGSLLVFRLSRQDRPGRELVLGQRFAMGTYVEIQAYSSSLGVSHLEPVFERIDLIERYQSRTMEGSDIHRYNALGVSDTVQVSPETYRVVESAIGLAEITGGLFDPTIGEIVRLWGIGTEEERIPDRIRIEEALVGVGYQSALQLLGDRNLRRLSRAELDLGGIAKGYAADEAALVLQAQGFESGLVSVGGDIAVFGEKPDGSLFRIGLQDPLRERGRYLAILEDTDIAVVTSGDYERYFELDGERYHHIIDPETGRPGESDLHSVSVIAESAMVADALATAFFLLGSEGSLALADKLEAVEVVLVRIDRHVLYSSSLEGRLILTSEEYTYEAR